jgi:hypothetical protein
MHEQGAEGLPSFTLPTPTDIQGGTNKVHCTLLPSDLADCEQDTVVPAPFPHPATLQHPPRLRISPVATYTSPWLCKSPQLCKSRGPQYIAAAPHKPPYIPTPPPIQAAHQHPATSSRQLRIQHLTASPNITDHRKPTACPHAPHLHQPTRMHDPTWLIHIANACA